MADHEYAYLSDVNAQLVLQQSDGGAHGVAFSTVQLVVETSPDRVMVSDTSIQVVSQSIPLNVRVAALGVQLLQQNGATDGYQFGNSYTNAQVVTTIGVPDTERQKAWTFDFDGHTFYVLDLADRGAVAYDLTTKSWSHWDTAGYEGHFNMKNGFHWRGGKQVIGGGILAGLLVAFDENSYLDEDFREVAYEVNGVVFVSTEKFVRQFALRLVGSPARTGLVDNVTPPVLNLSWSDDNGSTWSDPRGIELSMDNPSQRIEFRSLGAFSQPGRIFKMYDSGGIKFLAYVVADIEGM